MSTGENLSSGKEVRRRAFLEAGYELFSQKSIESVTLEDVAQASGYGVATLYRYFGNKSGLLLEIATWQWKEFFKENKSTRPDPEFEGCTALEMLEFYLDSFVNLYKKHRELLKFNQFLNIFIRSGEFAPGDLSLYQGLMEPIFKHFGQMYEKAQQDHTIRTDIPAEEMLSVTLHLMLAVVTRYAVGLAYEPKGFDAVKEIEMMKEMLLEKYTEV